MFPCLSAYTKFCPGTLHLDSAARNCCQFEAVCKSYNDSMMCPGLEAVHSNANGSLSVVPSVELIALSASESRGPCSVKRIVCVTGSPPLTLIVSVTTVSGFHPLADWY